MNTKHNPKLIQSTTNICKYIFVTWYSERFNTDSLTPGTMTQQVEPGVEKVNLYQPLKYSMSRSKL